MQAGSTGGAGTTLSAAAAVGVSWPGVGRLAGAVTVFFFDEPLLKTPLVRPASTESQDDGDADHAVAAELRRRCLGPAQLRHPCFPAGSLTGTLL